MLPRWSSASPSSLGVEMITGAQLDVEKAQCYGGTFGGSAPHPPNHCSCPPKREMCPPKRERCPPARIVLQNKVNGPVPLECISEPVLPKILLVPIGVARIFNWGRPKPQITGNDVIRNFQKRNFLWEQRCRRMEDLKL